MRRAGLPFKVRSARSVWWLTVSAGDMDQIAKHDICKPGSICCFPTQRLARQVRKPIVCNAIGRLLKDRNMHAAALSISTIPPRLAMRDRMQQWGRFMVRWMDLKRGRCFQVGL
ncbi:hypothetical protein GQ53DRAFT_205872 [Thozetella sp. PMI_491]|nr:hypothetical protein GQ53DRAFT_205872 [Thozetella sp. PMI_491]